MLSIDTCCKAAFYFFSTLRIILCNRLCLYYSLSLFLLPLYLYFLHNAEISARFYVCLIDLFGASITPTQADQHRYCPLAPRSASWRTRNAVDAVKFAVAFIHVLSLLRRDSRPLFLLLKESLYDTR